MPFATTFAAGSSARVPGKGLGTVLAVLPDFQMASVDFGQGPQPVMLAALQMPSFAERGSHIDCCQRRGGAVVYDLVAMRGRPSLRVAK